MRVSFWGRCGGVEVDWVEWFFMVGVITYKSVARVCDSLYHNESVTYKNKQGGRKNKL